jgi:hypothetical protein
MSNDRKDVFGSTLNPDGSLRCVSATQVNTFQLCPLKWHFEKKEKLPRKPMGKGAALGDKCHKQLEHFLKTGEDVRGALVHVGDSMLEPYLYAAPFNGGLGLVEEALIPMLKTPAGIAISGFEDFYVPGTVPVIIDHKFKKELDKYADTEETLPNDPQQIIYTAHAVLCRDPTAPAAEFRLHHVQTEGPGGRFPRAVSLRSTREDVLRRWGAMAKTIDTEMAEVAKIPVAEPGKTPDVPYKTESCGAFGGCDFARVCAHSPQNRFIGSLRGNIETANYQTPSPIERINPMGLLGQINAPAAVSAPVTVPVTIGAPAATPPVLKEIPVSACVPGGAYMLPGGPVGVFEGVIGSRPIFRLKSGGALAETASDATVRDMNSDPVASAPVKAPAPVQAPAAPKAEAPKRKLVIEDDGESILAPDEPVSQAVQPPPTIAAPIVQAPPVSPSPVVTVAVAEAIEPPKPKRGRPSKAEVAAREAVVTAPQAAAMAEMPAAPMKAPAIVTYDPAQTEPAPAAPKEGEPLMLLINCSCAQARPLEPYIADVCKRVATAGGAPDVRLGHKNSDLGFGGWKALIALEALKSPPSGLVSIQSSELADPIIEALVPKAAMVVRGGVR